MATKPNKSAGKVFTVLDALFRNFADGYTNGELAVATGMSQPVITRYVATLIEAGYAERIPETGRFRVSVALARKSIQIMQSLDAAEQRIRETTSRLLTKA